MRNCGQGENASSSPLIESIRASACIPDRYDHLSYLLDQSTVSGLYLEFGVFNADSINHIADIIAPHLIYGFDSFIGLPEEWKRRRDGSLTFPQGTFAVEAWPEVRANVRLVEGWFAETLPPFAIEHPE